MSNISNQIGPYCITPQWVFTQLKGDKQFHLCVALYNYLAFTANKSDMTCFPSRQTMAEEMCVKSVRTIDSALQTLERVGAITKTHRINRKTREHTSNLYSVMQVAQSVAPPSVTECTLINKQIISKYSIENGVNTKTSSRTRTSRKEKPVTIHNFDIDNEIDLVTVPGYNDKLRRAEKLSDTDMSWLDTEPITLIFDQNCFDVA